MSRDAKVPCCGERDVNGDCAYPICKGYIPPYTPPRCEHEWFSLEITEGDFRTTCARCGAWEQSSQGGNEEKA